MFKPGRFNGRLLLLAFAISLFMSAGGVRLAVAQPCNGIGQSVPGEVNIQPQWEPAIIPPTENLSSEGCLLVGTHNFTPSGGSPPYTWQVDVGTVEYEVDPETGTLNLTVDESDCGAVHVNLFDGMGRKVSTSACIDLNSQWVRTGAQGCCDWGSVCAVCVDGAFRYEVWIASPGMCGSTTTCGLSSPCSACQPTGKDFVGWIKIWTRTCK